MTLPIRLPTRLRSLLFAPGAKPELLPKLPRAGADAVVIDLEDAVPAHAKQEAREITREAVAALTGEHPDLPVLVRVNAVPTEWFADDLDALPEGVAGVVVPKLETAAQTSRVISSLDARGRRGVPLVAGIETAAGVWNVEEVLRPYAKAVYFGAEDYVADVGGMRTPESTEVLYARSRVALAARLAGVHSLDQVVTNFKDDAAFLADARAGRSLGFRGKLCIHPSQVALAHEAFSPSADEVERAEALLAAYEEGKAAGHAAVAFDGQMIDEPLARQARAVLEAAADG